MKACPRCDASLDDEARYCIDCGAPQTEAAAEELDEYVQRQAQEVIAETDTANGSSDVQTDTGTGPAGSDTADAGSGSMPVEALTDREQLWRRGCYVLGYGTIVVALTLVPAPGAFLLVLGGLAILPPIRRLTATPLGSPLKREVMAGAYVILSVLGGLLLLLL